MSLTLAEVTPSSSAMIMTFKLQRTTSPHWLSP